MLCDVIGQQLRRLEALEEENQGTRGIEGRLNDGIFSPSRRLETSEESEAYTGEGSSLGADGAHSVARSPGADKSEPTSTENKWSVAYTPQ